MSLPKRDGVNDRYYLIHKPDTSPEVLAEADLCIQDVLNGTARENHSAYLDARNPIPAETDFFIVTRMDAWGVSTWFMCTPEAAEKLIAMNYDNLAVKETTIVG